MNMFEPQLTLSREPDGDYTLDAVTITPNSSYSAGRAVQSAPPSVRLRPDVLPVLLHLRARTWSFDSGPRVARAFAQDERDW